MLERRPEMNISRSKKSTSTNSFDAIRSNIDNNNDNDTQSKNKNETIEKNKSLDDHENLLNYKGNVKKALGAREYYWMKRQFAWKLRETNNTDDPTGKKKFELSNTQKVIRKVTRSTKKFIAFYSRSEMEEAERKLIKAYYNTEDKKLIEKNIK